MNAVRSHSYALPRAPVAVDVRCAMAALEAKINKDVQMYSSRGKPAGSICESKENLTLPTLQWIVSAIRQYQLPIQIFSSNFGFNAIMITIYDHEYEEDGSRRQLKKLLRIKSEQFPIDKKLKREAYLDKAYELFLELLQPDDAYREVLHFYGFEVLPVTANGWHY